MGHASRKVQRLRQIEDLLLRHSEGLTQAEIARRLGVHRSTWEALKGHRRESSSLTRRELPCSRDKDILELVLGR